MNKEEFIILITRYREGNASELEEQQLINYFSSFQQPWDEEVFGSKAAAVSRIKEQLLAKIEHESVFAPIKPNHKIHFIRRFRWVAAAILLLALGAGWLYYMGLKDKQDLLVSNTPAQFLPGGNKAVLTLASGKTIVLDDASNGDVADQDGVRIIKLDSGLLSYKGTAVQVGYNTLTTPRGGQYQVELPDGSKVWINSASTLRYPTAFLGNNREVSLSGEAYFEVEKDPQHPFVVKTNEVNVQVLGTGFNVMAYPEEGAVRTTLLHGSVKVQSQQLEKMIIPGEQARIVGKQFEVTKPNLEQVLAWKNGSFNFQGADMRTIMRQISRWYDVDVEVQGDLGSVQFMGILSRRQNAEQLLEILAETGKVRFETKGRKIIVMSTSK